MGELVDLAEYRAAERRTRRNREKEMDEDLMKLSTKWKC